MEIEKIVNYQNDDNTYILKSSKKTAVIDPGCDADKIFDITGDKIDYIILTHCHFDHIESLRVLKEKTDVKIVFSKTGKSNLNNPDVNLSGMVYGKNIGTEPDILVADGDFIEFEDFKLKCIETPGHTSCGMCYLVDNNLFSGDTLFNKSIGRTDFPTGNYSILEGSVKNKIYTLDDNVTVFPGHGNKTSVGDEKKYNSFIRG